MIKACANSCKEHNCRNPTMPAHIYCAPCFVANRGYIRHNPPAPKSA
jgi:hypothetical protein